MAQVDYFLKIKGVDGESTDEKHKGEIELESWSFGGTNAASFSSGGGGGAGKVSLKDFKFRKKIDKASIKLFVAMSTGEHLPSAILTCRKAGKEQQEFLIITLTDTMVSSYDTGGSAEAPGADPRGVLLVVVAPLSQRESFAIDRARIVL